MKYYGNITTNLQFILVKRWVKDNWTKRFIIKLIGTPIDIRIPMVDIIKELTK